MDENGHGELMEWKAWAYIYADTDAYIIITYVKHKHIVVRWSTQVYPHG